jgi:hypothetical protein
VPGLGRRPQKSLGLNQKLAGLMNRSPNVFFCDCGLESVVALGAPVEGGHEPAVELCSDQARLGEVLAE